MSVNPNPFTAPVLAELKDAGWTTDRKYQISAWILELGQQGYQISVAAEEALSSFGGLRLNPVNRVGSNFSNDDPLIFDPILAGSGHYALAEELHEELSGDWYPLGEWLSNSS